MDIKGTAHLFINGLKNLIRFGEWSYLDTRRVRIPRNTTVYGKATLIRVDGAEISIGENVTLNSKPFGYHAGMSFATALLADRPGATISIGDNCRINGAYLHAKESISIGQNCVIAAGTNIIDSNGHVVASLNRTKGSDTSKPIIIGNNVWICTNAVVLKGSVIGDNCVISANSVVSGVFPDNCIIQGNPAVVAGVINFDNKTIR